MKHSQKYTRGYFNPPCGDMNWSKKEYVDHAPIWCSVDLRDGNQSLVVPMGLEDKISFFTFLVGLGFKEIEVGFPAASETEYSFIRALIEEELIPDDVTIQVLTQSREHIIAKTFESLEGCKNAIVHLYNSTSVAQREQVFHKSKEEIKEIAVSGAKLCKEYNKKMGGKFRFEYSPESFTGTEIDFALDVCNSVLDVWQPDAEKPVIINLPATVSMSMPHVYANQIEYMCNSIKYNENVIISLHPHNDRGCAVADAEMGMLAGGARVEGTLFGNGERTGNVDIITLALNMYSHGVDPQLNLENIPAITEMYEEMTNMHVPERQPYGGQLVFAAFSGSHQDAIAKGMKWREDHNCDHWNVPYLPIDPKDIGREYEGDVIRINSQSGKGGIGYLMQKRFGIEMPAKMQENFGYAIKSVSDHKRKELQPQEMYDIFMHQYVNIETPIALGEFHFTHDSVYHTEVSVTVDCKKIQLVGEGNGRFDAVSNALESGLNIRFTDLVYKEHDLDSGSNSRAIAYVGITSPSGTAYWGSGLHNDIIAASIQALFSAVNKMRVSEIQ